MHGLSARRQQDGRKQPATTKQSRHMVICLPSYSACLPAGELRRASGGGGGGGDQALTRHDMTTASWGMPPSRISSQPIMCFLRAYRNLAMRLMNQLCSWYSSRRPSFLMRSWQRGHFCHRTLGHCISLTLSRQATLTAPPVCAAIVPEHDLLGSK